MDFFTAVTLYAAGAVLVVQQILKLKIVPLAFANRYPVPTNIVLSIVAAVVATWQTDVQPHTWNQWVAFVGLIAVVAAAAYNQLIGKWAELRSMEG
jgi:hypothetical protein